MSLFGSLYLGVSGLQTSQNALNTTAHNMSNIDTIGYTRQQVQQGTRVYNTLSTSAAANAYIQTGLGVSYIQVKHIRDYFLDKNYRREAGRSAFYGVSATALEEVQDLYQELEGKSFSKSIENLWTAVQELAKDPGGAVNQGVFVQRCNEFLTRGQAIYAGLCDYQDNLNYQIKQQVDTMNAYGKRIMELNQEIMKIEGGGIEKANDLRDERDLLVDELASMASLELKTDVNGNYLIYLEGTDFVKAQSFNKIGLDADVKTGFFTPYWEQLEKRDADGNLNQGAKLYKMNQIISTDRNTDIGSLKSMLYARGDKRATYEDLALEPPTHPGAGATQDELDEYNAKLQEYNTKEHYNKVVSQSVIMHQQAQFDQLIHGIVMAVNKVLADAANNATALDPNSTYMRDPATGNPYTIFNTQTGDTKPEAFTVENLIINGKIKEAPTLLGFKKDDDKIDQETADALKKIFEDESLQLNPNVKTKTTFIDYYSDLVSQVANSGSVMRTISENQEMTVDNIAAAREQIIGVSSDEELSNMIMFQNAYNASSRYINVISELMEHVINTLGR